MAAVTGGRAALGALNALDLGSAHRALLPQAGRELQGQQQQEAQDRGHGQLAEQAPALPEALIGRIEAHTDLQQGQGEQGQKGAIDQRVAEAPLPGRLQQLEGEHHRHQLQREGEHEDQGQQAEAAQGHG
ncbi:MAG: hypothetical protein VKK97_01110 [Synechococcaceae cyanobacterium]|nr:hypothetical protein [Synechococcaceae cyanobacterium]